MDDDDYRALIEVVAEEMRASGAAYLADERHYSSTEETGDTHLLKPQHRLIGMLEAFYRFLSIQDRETYRSALSSIARSVEGTAPQRASVLLTTDDEPREYDLSEVPELGQVREDLQSLIARIIDGDLRPHGQERR